MYIQRGARTTLPFVLFFFDAEKKNSKDNLKIDFFENRKIRFKISTKFTKAFPLQNDDETEQPEGGGGAFQKHILSLGKVQTD